MKNKLLAVGTIGMLTPIMVSNVASANEINENNVINENIQSRSIESVMNETGVVEIKAGSNLNIRESYGTNSKIVGKIPAKRTITILGETNGWYKVRYNGIEGYSSSEYIRLVNSSQVMPNIEQSVIGNGKVVNMSSRLNVRASATTSSNVIGTLNSGQVVKLVSKTNSGWYKIEFNNSVGYVYGNYITLTSEGTTSTGSSSSTSKVGKIATVTAYALNVRSGAGVNYSVVNKLYKDNNVKVLDINSNGWNKVQLSSGLTGWVSGKYLTNYREGNLDTNTNTNTNANTNTNTGVNTNTSSNKAIDAVINIAKSKLGSPYEWGAEGPNSFDCSGLMHYIFKNGAGVTLPRTSSSQASAGYAVSKSQLKPGDLVFFNTNGKGISHVGVYIGNNEMIHSTKPGDVVKKTSINSSYYSARFVTARRIVG